MKKVVDKLKLLKKTISTMESCTGGGLVNSITDIEGASEIIKFSAVTYSNEFKIKMGISKETIEKYTVYSMEIANEMSKCISLFTNSNYGIGITGQLRKSDPFNTVENNNIVYVSIYDKDNNKYYNNSYIVEKDSRKENKEYIINRVLKMLYNII